MTIMYTIIVAVVVSLVCLTASITFNGQLKDRPISMEEENTPVKFDNGGLIISY